MLLGNEVLLKILREQDLKTFSKLDERFFIDPEEKRNYERCFEYLQRYGELPPQDFIETFEDLSENRIAYLVDSLKIRYRRYFLGNISEAIKNTAELATIEDMLTNYLFDSILSESTGVVGDDDAVELVADSLTRARENYIRMGLSGFPTGWHSLDEATGGYVEGDVYVFSGRAKMGKTMLMIYSANQLLEQFEDMKILFISMEMTNKQVLSRIACLRSGVNPSVIRIGDITTPAEEAILQALRPITSRFTVSEGNLDRSLSSIISTIGSLQPTIVFIDGAYLIKSKYKTSANWEDVKEVVERLKGIAINFKLPIICSYQLKRGARKDNMDLEHLALSDAIGQVASVVIGITECDMPDTKKLLTMGVREGVKDSFYINWDWNSLSFSEKEFTQ